MKKLFLLLTTLLVLNPTLKAEEEMATVRCMMPDRFKDDLFFRSFHNLMLTTTYFVAANDTYVGKFKYGQYIDVKLAPGTYNIVVYLNGNYKVVSFGDCSFEEARDNGMARKFKNITVEAGRMYYISMYGTGHKLANERAFREAWAYNQLEYVENEVQSPPSQNEALASNSSDTPEAQKPAGKNSKVDQNIPSSATSNDDTYVLIIANEHYQELSPVTYAANDGLIFKDYCTKTLGIPETQVRYYPDASYGNMVGAVDWLKYALDNFSGAKAIVYYCGHGIPDEKTGQAYLIPVDGKGTNMKTCYSLQDLYKSLAATKAQSITYFMDACFTGATKEGSMLVAARGVARAPEKETLSGKTIVFSASSGDETAMTLDKEGHGLFTYYLLKKLQESEGNVTYGDLADYLHQHVKKDAFLINEKPQTPVVATSPAVVSTWKQMKLK